MRRWAAIATNRTTITATNPTGAIAIAGTFYAVHAIAIAISDRHHRHGPGHCPCRSRRRSGSMGSRFCCRRPAGRYQSDLSCTATALDEISSRYAGSIAPGRCPIILTVGLLQIEILAD